MKIKTICVKGVLHNGILRYQPIESEFQNNDWHLKLNSIAIQNTIAFSEVVTITCNFITSQQYGNDSRIRTYEMPLQMFHFKLGPNEKGSLRFNDPLWYKITSPSSVLEFKFVNFEDRPLPHNNVQWKLCFSIAQK